MRSPPSDPFLGKRIREYEILALIGQGRMGALYRARHVLLEQERAIKIVQTGMAGASELAERFIREARVLARMRHPNLVELYEFGKLEEGTFFMILELLKGESVRRRVDTLERIPPLDAVRIAREAASGLHVAHSTGILHRDVSADNLFLVKSEAGEESTKVIDFAIAKPTVQEARTMQSTQVLMGKPEFWSPEQFGIGGRNATLDQRTDIYSLAVTLYFMITGKLPFVSLVPKGTPEPIVTNDVPPKLERVIRKALSIEREERQESMMELIQELDEVTYRQVPPTIQVAPPPSARFQPGFVFAGRYEIQKKIGRGGMGTVFKALDRILEIPVALKTMNPEISADVKTLARLKREVILARKVAHPNVCRLYDIGECDGIHYVSMEFVDGMTLSDMLLLRGKLPAAEGLQMLRQILLALQEAHRAGVIHRDLKPQNIMVDVHQRAFIMDFGISYSADVERLTTTGMMIGTPRYMAPEQFGETPSDLRADIYSMGIIFYETFTGRLPFEAQTPASVMYAHLHTPPMPPTRLDPGIPLKLESIILKALEKDPGKRFQNVGEMIAAIDDSLAHPEIAATQKAASPPPPVPPPRPAPAPAAPRPGPGTPAVRTESVPELPPEPRSMVAPILIIFVALLALGAATYYYFISRTRVPTPVSTPTAGAPEQVPARREAEAPVSEKAAPKQEAKSTPLPNEPQSQAVAPPQQQPVREEVHPPAQAEPSTPTLPVPAPAPAPAPATRGPGRITYQGEYAVSIFEGRKLILNTANAGSAELPAGAHDLTLISTTKAVIRQNLKVEVKEGETLTIPAPAMSRLSLNASPSNCKIFIDMDFVDVAPIFDLPIQAGNHHVRAVWENQGKEKSGFFTIAPDQSLKLRAIADETTQDIFEITSPREKSASVSTPEKEKVITAPAPDVTKREPSAAPQQEKPKMVDANARNRAVQLMQRGFEAMNKKDFAGAEAAYREALGTAQQVGDSGIQVNALNSLGFIFSRQGNDAKARDTWQQSLDVSIQFGDKAAQALALFNLSTAEFNLGNQDKANSLYEQSATRYKEVGQTPRPRPW